MPHFATISPYHPLSEPHIIFVAAVARIGLKSGFGVTHVSQKHREIGDFRPSSRACLRQKSFRWTRVVCVGLPCFSCSNPFVTYLPPPSAIAAAAHFCCPLQIRPQRYCCRFRSVHQIGLSKAKRALNTILKTLNYPPDKESHKVAKRIDGTLTAYSILIYICIVHVGPWL